ncbi:hypothetical protein BAUCODRAFT_55091, partial [Baudoinia panamericana UAMH 10762]
GTPSGTRRTPPRVDATPEDTDAQAPVLKPGHQRFVLTDPVAFRYLEEDPSTTVLERRRDLHGYECYIVEQWTTSRTHPTFVITTYTGDPSHVVVAGVLSVPTNEHDWSPRLRVYFKALNQYHARRRETPLGILMVTNLSGFPSSLTVIPVPGGDLRKHRFDFFVNEDLKRLGCSGRVGLTLANPAQSTVAKFHQLYRTSDKNELYKSVIELVKLCQSALMLFDKLEIDYADGLLCDVTERAINDWWVDIGSEQYSIEPHDGILGPTTVAGLLGLLMGARNRLHAVGAPVAKDPFDVDAMKRGISHFQKQQRMPRSRRLDRRTLDRLHKATQKAAEHEGWSMPKVIKNTAAELSGKGGEMIADAVGRRDRAGLAEIETCDIERFVELIYGERCKWLWRGKPMKHRQETQRRERAESDARPHKGLVFKHDDQGGFTWTARKSTADGVPMSAVERDVPEEALTPVESSDDETRFKVFRRATDLKNEAKSGLGKIKGAVGLKGHQQKPSVDESPTTPVEENGPSKRRPLFRRAHSSPLSSPNSPRSPTLDSRLQALHEQRSRDGADALPTRGQQPPPSYPTAFAQTVGDPKENFMPASLGDREQVQDSGDSGKPGESTQPSERTSRDRTAEPSIAGSIYNGVDLDDILPTGPGTEKDVGNLLKRTISLSYIAQPEQRPNDAYPRHLSFSLAEDSVLVRPDVTEDDEGFYDDPTAQLAEQEFLAKQAHNLRQALNSLQTSAAPWTQSQLRALDSLLEQADRDTQHLSDMHGPFIEHVNVLQTHSEGVLRAQKDRFEEGGKEIETLIAKLDYEIDGLKSKIDDVGAGVQDFAKGVARVEERV